MTTAVLRMQKNIYSRVKSVEFPQINWGVVCFMGIMACSLLLVFYIYQINVLLKGTYLVDNYAKEIKKIAQENKALEVSFAENNFLVGVLEKTQELNFQKATSVEYIQVVENTLANAK
jgi:hypothetical protein